MAKRNVLPRPVVRDGLVVLGQLIREARINRRWSRDELAARADVSVPTIAKIEAGEPTTAVGTVFGVADLVGVPIFGIEDPLELVRLRRRGEEKLALLPSRVRAQKVELNDDF